MKTNVLILAATMLTISTQSMVADTTNTSNTYTYSNVEYCQLKADSRNTKLVKTYKGKLTKYWKKEYGEKLDSKHISKSTCKDVIAKFGRLDKNKKIG
jgi:hypothetical protein